jgi:hypothetical protein
MTDFDPLVAVNTVIEKKSEREREEEARFQADERAKLHLPTEVDIRAQLGARMVTMAQAALEENDDDFEATRLAEGYALQGDYRKAALITRDAARKREYEVIIAAVDNPQDCLCPVKSQNSSTRFVKDRILFEGQVRELIACSLCKNIKC